MAKAADLSAASELCPERRKVITEGGAQLLGRERHARACALNTALTSLVQRNKGPSAPCVEALEEHVLLRVGHEVVGRLLARDLDERLQHAEQLPARVLQVLHARQRGSFVA